MKKSRARKAIVLAGLLVAAVLVLLLAPFVGANTIALSDVFDFSAGARGSPIFWQIRVPRVLVAFLAGSGLALSGLAFQSMFRNPLATPFTLGVASGASLGAAVAIRLGLTLVVLGVSMVSVFAFAGALMSIALVYGITRVKKGFSTATMLLAGVAIGFLFSSIILFVQYISDFAESFRIVRWLMGGLDVVGFDYVLDLVPFVAVGAVIVIYLTNELNLLSTGDDIAASRGVDVKKTRRTLFFATSLMVGGVVAVCGPIGFVGMMSPHICRLLVGADHKLLTPVTLLFGGVFLTLCDTLARMAIAPAEIPVGVITALLGGPFFIWLLLRGRSEQGLL